MMTIEGMKLAGIRGTASRSGTDPDGKVGWAAFVDVASGSKVSFTPARNLVNDENPSDRFYDTKLLVESKKPAQCPATSVGLRPDGRWGIKHTSFRKLGGGYAAF